jgi:integrase
MSRKYHKTFISNNGNNFYLQFHIKDWMRRLPDFVNLPASKKNFKETLRTSDYNLAYERANKRLKELQIIDRPKSEPVLVGADAYWKGTQDFETMTDTELDTMYDYLTEMISSSSISDHIHELKITDEQSFSNAENNLLAIEREREKRKSKFYDKPHPYPVGLVVMSNKYMEELKAEGKSLKTQNKVKNATKRFLEYREIPDIELRLITHKIVSDYIKFARTEDRAERTFRNDLNYLGAVFNFARNYGYIQKIPNPFREQKIPNFRKPINRKPFNNDMIAKLLELNKNDKELTQLIYVSYYTGMRLDEIYNAELARVENIRVFKVAENGGKTDSATRIIPLHSELKKIDLTKWQSPSSTSIGKRFGRLKDKMLVELGLEEDKNKFVHHSFRHGFSTILLNSRYTELEIADLTGHKKSNIGRTQAGKTYFARQPMSKLIQMIESIPKLEA